MSEWPSFEVQAAHHDWSAFDRLVTTSPTPRLRALCSFISDTKIATRDGYQERTAAAFCSVLVVIPLAKLSEKKDQPGRHRGAPLLHRATPSDMELFIDQMVLLRAAATAAGISCLT